VADPAQIATPDARTVVFDLGRPQPLFESAIAAPYGPYVVNARLAKEHEEDGDWGHAWAQTSAEGMGTGPYRVTTFAPEEQAVLDKYDGYWGGWEGDHFDRVVIRVVPENATLRQLIEQGEIDIVDNLTPETTDVLAQDPALRVDRAYTTSDIYLAMTVAGPLASPAARQAMAWAFPYDDVIQGVYQGYAKQGTGSACGADAGLRPRPPRLLHRPRKGAATPRGGGGGGGHDPIDHAHGRQRGGQHDGATVRCEPGAARPHAGCPGRRRNHVHRDGVRRGPGGGAPELLPVRLAAGLRRRLEPPFAPARLRRRLRQGVERRRVLQRAVDELLDQARDAGRPEAYQQALSEIQNIVTWEDPAGVYYAQIQWTTILRQDIAGFTTNPIATGLYDFYRMSRTA
jgi:peptide/nickel transport system substrate-binding protein